jgi:hypothetical protein
MVGSGDARCNGLFTFISAQGTNLSFASRARDPGVSDATGPWTSRALPASASVGITSLPACKRCGRKGRPSMRIFTPGWHLRVEETACDSGRGRTPESNFVGRSARRLTTSSERGPGALEQGFQQHQQHLRRERGEAQVAAPWRIPFIERVESRCRFRIARHANSAGDRQIDRNKTSGPGPEPAVTCYSVTCYSSNQQPSQWPPPLLPPRPPRC